MILYHIITTYHILEAIVHRINYEKNEYAVLLFPDFGIKKFPQYRQLMNFFDEVVVFPYESIRHSDYERDTLAAVNGLHNFDVNKFSRIYLAGAQFYFSFYLIKKNIPFIFFEEAGGNLSKPEDWIITMHKEEQREYAIKYGLLNGENTLIEYKLGNVSAQKKDFKDDKLVDFNLSEELLRIEETKVDLITSFFGLPKLLFEDNSIIVMTQHFAGLKMMTYEEQVVMYSLVLDYFASGYKVVFKCHPDDVVPYEYLFPQALVIREKFPMELIPFTSQILPKAIMTISSTGINNVKGNFREVINFDVDFQNKAQYRFLHRYFFANEIVSKFSKGRLVLKKNLIKCIQDRFECLKTLSEYDGSCEAGAIIVVDELENENVLSEMIKTNPLFIIFLNTSGKYSFERYLISERNKFVIREICYSNSKENSEFLYIFVNDEKIKEELYHMEEKKNLEYTGMEIDLRNLSEKDLEISVLRGQLEAAEKRLLYYIKREQNKADDNS